tara:strand:+ start:149 stop:367 length:219 start_codon:yes stop_codon:yes gene_type:complete
MKFITILNTPDNFQIAIIKNLFDLQKINYRITDEVVNSAAGIGGLGITGMRVQVIEEDLITARQILEEASIL